MTIFSTGFLFSGVIKSALQKQLFVKQKGLFPVVAPQEKVSFNPVAMDSHVPGFRRTDGTAALLFCGATTPFS
jgi:hypothetical protein